jgi:hypothetical protein
MASRSWSVLLPFYSSYSPTAVEPSTGRCLSRTSTASTRRSLCRKWHNGLALRQSASDSVDKVSSARKMAWFPICIKRFPLTVVK